MRRTDLTSTLNASVVQVTQTLEASQTNEKQMYVGHTEGESETKYNSHISLIHF